MLAMKTATLGGGCFWCVEAVYQQLKGIKRVVSGYAGGAIENPSYEQVVTGTTGHAEVTQITYDPDVITYKEILEVFFAAHDPTTLNRQGNDVGTQYRSIILYHNDEQKQIAKDMIDNLQESGKFKNSIVTELVPFEKFYPAEDYHQNYYRRNRNQGYCRFVIDPKISKVKREFKLMLHDS
ncbi:MAG: peptide-methionine (S)-S-oxide reductase MsrA [Candidatus Lokiarchaeota archaeon]|nr:peptide-methionine (S)-S-oxide reductase MsrA [Candidatus Lokiarchaeota archaeon]